MHTQFWSKYMKGRDHSGKLGIDGRIILKLVFKTGCLGVQ
jgi:hypothetical protein